MMALQGMHVFHASKVTRLNQKRSAREIPERFFQEHFNFLHTAIPSFLILMKRGICC